jgi:hypothetical protein
LFLLIAVVLVLLLLVPRLVPGGEWDGAMPATIVKVTPTAFASPISPPTADCETIVSSDEAQASVPLPISLSLAGNSIPVTPAILQDPATIYPAGYSGTAIWVCGTVVNYVVALEPTVDNSTLLAGLRVGDEIGLQLSNGIDLTFRFSEMLELPIGDESVLAQGHPHLSVVIQEGGTWLIANADYAAEAEQVPSSGEGHALPGQSVQVGDVRVTVEEGHVERDMQGLQPGTMYYLVEFSLENSGVGSVNINDFALRLQDGTGTWYDVSSEASAMGEYGWLMTEIAPGSTAQATAGYVVPEAMSGTAVIWSFMGASGEQASFSIPYQPSESSTSVVQVDVTITDAFVSSDGSLVVIEGELQNGGDTAVTVELADTSLTSSAGSSELRLAAPPLPWTVEPGKTQVIELQFSRPDASTALLSLMGYTFEIQGLK